MGFYDTKSGLHCNPYIIIDNGEAVVIDGGSRPEFPVVMKKILQTGIVPSSISTLIYQHYDPDLCGSIRSFEEIINRDDLRVLSEKENNYFIRHYGIKSKLTDLVDINHKFQFSSGRTLQFIPTPYSHSPGSFITFDQKSGVLFTSDLFGSYSKEWDLFMELNDECSACNDFPSCPVGKKYCQLPDLLDFHRRIMTSNKALRYAIKEIIKTPFTIIAPQHGSVINKKEDIQTICRLLLNLENVGIDGVC